MAPPFLMKHRNNTDVAIEVLKSFFVREKQTWKIKVRWWRISRLRPPRPMYIEQKIQITRSQMRDWERYT